MAPRHRLLVLAVMVVTALAVPVGASAATPSRHLSPKLGLRIDGYLWRQHAGTFVAGAGDVNGDGLDDILVGTQESHREGPRLPSPVWNAYVVFGRRGAPGHVLRLDRLGSRGLRLVGHGGGFTSGAGLGDVNGDGLDDIALGASRTWIVFGRHTGATIDVQHLGTRGLTVTGTTGGLRGQSVAGAGDLDRDGYADVLVPDPDTAPPGGRFGTGRVLVVFGARRGGTIDVRRVGARVSQIIGPGPFDIGGRLYGTGFGFSVAGAGDVNGDRRSDVLVGAPFAGGNQGAAFVILRAGRRGATIDLRAPESGWYRVTGSSGTQAGWSVASAGDQNGDGLRDLLIGSLAGGSRLTAATGASDAHVVFGRSDPGDVALGALGPFGATLHDATSGDRAGQSVANLGDVTGDGIADLLVGAPLADHGGVSAAGSVFLVPGGSLGETVDLRDLTGGGARRFDGVASYETAGWSVTGLGDVNGDHRRDFAVGAPRANGRTTRTGSVYVVYG